MIGQSDYFLPAPYQWTATLATYAYPVIGKLAVAAVDTGLVIKILEPIWSEKNETASRVRGRIEAVLDWAKVRGYRDGDNPARWRGHLDQVLPKRAKVAAPRHQPALPHERIGEFVAALRQQPGMAARALEFLILTMTRTTETLDAKWAEISLAEKVWTIPAARMKGGRLHRVPLSDRAFEILTDLRAGNSGDGFVFPGAKAGRPLSNMSCEMLIRRMNGDDAPVWFDPTDGRPIVPHGFRSTARDWTGECTAFPRDVCEMALAHALESKVEAAYRRGDLFEKRRRLMDAWSEHCATVRIDGTNVVPMRATG